MVCVTKYRQKILNSESLKLIEKSFPDVAGKMNFQIGEFKGEKYPVHVLIE
jgi:putative transposase